MKGKLFFIIVLFFIANQGYSQSTERFIRIIGNSTHEFVANSSKIKIEISGIPENKREEKPSIPFKEIYNKYISKLDSIGIDEKELVRSEVSVSRYSKNISKIYTLLLENIDNIDKVVSIKQKGVSVNSIMYVYNTVEPKIQENLMLSAIEDAKRKATNICNKLNMKLGRILNIEDSSGSCCANIKDSKELKTFKKYSINITFELKDK